MFDPNLPPLGIALVIALLVISLGIHEAAHAWVAYKCGDTTARDLGRITLNPVVHIDPFMTIVLPLVLYLSSGFVFGGAKPVPVNFYNLRRSHFDMALVALAGPVSNFLIAALLWTIQKVSLDPTLGFWEENMLGPKVLQGGVYLNLLLAAFNLVPIPPLDGSRVMAWLLPKDLRQPYIRLEPFGMILVILLVFVVPGFDRLLYGTMGAMLQAIKATVTLGGLW